MRISGTWLLGFLRKSYCRLFGPEGGVFRAEILGISASFYVRTQAAAQGLKSPRETKLLEKMVQMLHAGDCAYDIGAGFGLYTLFLAHVTGKQGTVAAFEPAPHINRYLKDNIRLNGLTNVRVFQIALGDCNAVEKLELTGSPRLLQSELKQTTHELTETVEVVEGDMWVKNLLLPIPRVVKIDVEGYEYAVIRGLSHTLAQDTCEAVCCEIHPHLLPDGVTKEHILGLFDSLGFCRIETHNCAPRVHHVLCYKS